MIGTSGEGTPEGAPRPQRKSRVVGNLYPPDGPAPAPASAPGGPGAQFSLAPQAPEVPAEVILELNTAYPGGLKRIRRDFGNLVKSFEAASNSELREPVALSRRLYQCVFTPSELALFLSLDLPTASSSGEKLIFHVWPDYELYPQIDRSAPTVKVDAARRSYTAQGKGIVWAVVDTGIDARHPHFANLELSKAPATGHLTGGLHRDFSSLVQPSRIQVPIPVSPLTDEAGHGTHVAAIIAGACPPGRTPNVASSDEPPDHGFVSRSPSQDLQGMAPECELVSLKVCRLINGAAVTSSAALIAALEYIRTEVNLSRNAMRIHGVNLSLGCEWDPSHYAAGQSPLCQLINELVDSGVNVVISAGNNGSAKPAPLAKQFVGVAASITEPGHAEKCITVGSTHRDAPHTFGVSWTSSKGPTLDGRSKPDVVAPGEWICSAATGIIRTSAGLDGLAVEPDLTYAEQSGTSMAAPHVSGILAGFLSSRPEFIGRPTEVKAFVIRTAVDLGRDRNAQGAGLIDSMRMLGDS